jgi:hypothetical protein
MARPVGVRGWREPVGAAAEARAASMTEQAGAIKRGHE